MTTDNTAVIRQLGREVELLREENKALRCQVERLRQSGNRVIHYGEPKSDWDNTVVECLKGQCTAAVRADAVESFANHIETDPYETTKFSEMARKYAQQIRTGGDDE